MKELKSTDFKLNNNIVSIKNVKGPGMLLIWAKWCGHCTKFKPTYTKLSEYLGNSFPCFAIEDTQIKHAEFLQKGLDFKGFPTIKLIDATGKVTETYSGSRDLDDILTFICTKYSYCPKH